MTPQELLAPPAETVARVARAVATAALRGLVRVPPRRLGPFSDAWPPLLEALPALLRSDARRVLSAVGRVDVLPVLVQLAAGELQNVHLERALATLWLGIAGHPGLTSALLLRGPFRCTVVDPHAARQLALGNVRGVVATARGPVLIGDAGRHAIDECVVGPLPHANGTVIVDADGKPADPEATAQARAALARIGAVWPGTGLERVTIAAGPAAFGEARVPPPVTSAAIVASAHAAFVRAALTLAPMVGSDGTRVEGGRRCTPTEIRARACANAAALPWRERREAACGAIVDDLEELAVLGAPTAALSELTSVLRATAGNLASERPRALLVNPDADDFVYSFQFGRSVERRCHERGWRLDRISVHPDRRLALAAELGHSIPAPIADGTEFLVDGEDDPSVAAVLQRLSSRRYEVVVANVRPRVFHDLLAGGFLAAPALLWDRHLHGGLRAEGDRRGVDVGVLGSPRIRVWSLTDKTRDGLQRDLAHAGLRYGSRQPWPIDLDFFRSPATPQSGRVFAGGDNGRDWPLLVEAVRDLPLEVHLVTSQAPAALPPNIQLDTRLTL